MNNRIYNYKIRKVIYKIMFDSEDREYREFTDLFNISFLDILKEVIKVYSDYNYLSDDVIKNINIFLFQAREYVDENREERIEIINETIKIMNNQELDNSLRFYRYQLYNRNFDENYLYPSKISDEEIIL